MNRSSTHRVGTLRVGLLFSMLVKSDKGVDTKVMHKIEIEPGSPNSPFLPVTIKTMQTNTALNNLRWENGGFL